MPDSRATADLVYRQEAGKILATLIRLSSSFDQAEEALQEAFASALASWPERGIPDNAAAWITAAAHRKLIDAGRRESTRKNKAPELTYHIESTAQAENSICPEDMFLPDDRLRLMFTCCHPALSVESQIGLTLRTLGGLTTTEIARAFLLPEATLAQRLVRAKKKIQTARIPYEIPPKERLPERLGAVQYVLYLIFNEGYSATVGSELVRRDLAAEAIRLGEVLCRLMPNEAENLGLLALMLLHDSRRLARVSADGELILLEDQDRALWDRKHIQTGLDLLRQALQMRRAGPYQIQAAIAAVHAEAATATDTDWRQIMLLYEELARFNPSPVVRLNQAVSIAMADGLEAGLAAMDKLAESGALEGYHLLHSSRADLLRRLRRSDEAADAYRKALELATNSVERNFLQTRLRDLTPEGLE